MVLSLFLLVLILAIAFYQAMQGLFSALITVVLALCCAAFSFGTYEWVAINWLGNWPQYGYPCALLLTFCAPLLTLRIIFDQVIRRAPLLPSIMDRAGGGVCGIITSLVLVGMLAMSIQLMPFHYSFLTYARVDVPSQKQEEDSDVTPEPPDLDAEEHELFLLPDRFAVGVGRMLSGGLFSGKCSLADEAPDMVQAAGWVGATAAEVSRYASANSVSVIKTDTVEYVYSYKMAGRRRRGESDAGTYETITPKANRYFRVIRLKLGSGARDQFKKHMFTLRQIRLIGQDDAQGPWKQYFPMAIQAEDPQFADRHIAKKSTRWGMWHVVDDICQPIREHPDEVEVVYELPKGFVPIYLEYKQGAVVAVSFSGNGSGRSGRTSTADRGSSSTAGSSFAEVPPLPARDGVPNRGRGGRVRGFTTLTGASFFGDKFPMEMKAYLKQKNAEVRRGKLTSGHLVGYVDEQANGSNQAVSRFDVPSDKRLLHLNVDSLPAGSLLGRAMSHAVQTVQNFIVEDGNGRQYQVLGKYAIASVGGQYVIEVEYFPEQAGSIGGLGKFSKINEANLSGDYAMVLLFLVDPGARITSFSTGGSAMRRDNLEAENLVAPP